MSLTTGTQLGSYMEFRDGDEILKCKNFVSVPKFHVDVEKTAAVLKVSAVTVKRDWRLARAWLARELRGSNSNG